MPHHEVIRSEPRAPIALGEQHHMTRRHGFSLLAAIIAVIVAMSTAIYIGVAADSGTRDRTALPRSRPARPSPAPGPRAPPPPPPPPGSGSAPGPPPQSAPSPAPRPRA